MKTESDQLSETLCFLVIWTSERGRKPRTPVVLSISTSSLDISAEHDMSTRRGTPQFRRRTMLPKSGGYTSEPSNLAACFLLATRLAQPPTQKTDAIVSSKRRKISFGLQIIAPYIVKAVRTSNPIRTCARKICMSRKYIIMRCLLPRKNKKVTKIFTCGRKHHELANWWEIDTH
jgi:hypothetical protein